MIIPGTINEPYGIPSTSVILEPIADPKTIKYSEVEIRGEIRL